MSATKIIIHKFVGGTNFKSLYVTIEDGEHSSETRFSEWTDGKAQGKKKDSERSRLVVKIVSGSELHKFNLDYCAREVHDVEKYLNKTSDSAFSNFSLCQKSSNDYESQHNINYNTLNSFSDYIGDRRTINQSKFSNALEETIGKEQTFYANKNKDPDRYNLCGTKEFLNPLEHSLEKVKENNARIMENIHMLNRTLNYTKKKEILDIMCPKSMSSYPCNTCGKCFVYETGLRRHCSMRHATIEIQPRWQIVWTCVQCFQVWPRQDQAVKHTGECCKPESPDCIREIKTSSLLQCEYCEKVFTSIPRLLRHFKTHTTTNNYECNACEIPFVSYKAAEQHWFLCPWIKIYYCFSLPKLLLCNACDRKFRNYEQLYNHRYKVGHFMMKMHCADGNVKSGGTLVYQCEICGHWCSSVLQLRAHRSQYHASVPQEIEMQPKNDINLSQGYYMPVGTDFSVNQIEDVDREC